ncbi:MAG: hypothetical protein ACI9BD_000094 [Candidatus Marinamargulisbacteria bacterium]|jgi:hypothetical protein
MSFNKKKIPIRYTEGTILNIVTLLKSLSLARSEESKDLMAQLVTQNADICKSLVEQLETKDAYFSQQLGDVLTDVGLQ